jgi:hypothetical protein
MGLTTISIWSVWTAFSPMSKLYCAVRTKQFLLPHCSSRSLFPSNRARIWSRQRPSPSLSMLPFVDTLPNFCNYKHQTLQIQCSLILTFPSYSCKPWHKMVTKVRPQCVHSQGDRDFFKTCAALASRQKGGISALGQVRFLDKYAYTVSYRSSNVQSHLRQTHS